MSKKKEPTITFEQGEKVKLQYPDKPGALPIGHGAPAGGISVSHNGEQTLLEYGRTFQVSENTSAAVANLANSPLPLINAGWLNASPLASQFKKIETQPDNN